MVFEKLTKKKGVAKILLLDGEGDILDCEFIGGEAVTIQTEELSYLSITKQNLLDLLDAMNRAEKYYEDYYRKEDEKEEKMKK